MAKRIPATSMVRPALDGGSDMCIVNEGVVKKHGLPAIEEIQRRLRMANKSVLVTKLEVKNPNVDYKDITVTPTLTVLANLLMTSSLEPNRQGCFGGMIRGKEQ